jgi:hypothetical protein
MIYNDDGYVLFDPDDFTHIYRVMDDLPLEDDYSEESDANSVCDDRDDWTVL